MITEHVHYSDVFLIHVPGQTPRHKGIDYLVDRNTPGDGDSVRERADDLFRKMTLSHSGQIVQMFRLEADAVPGHGINRYLAPTLGATR